MVPHRPAAPQASTLLRPVPAPDETVVAGWEDGTRLAEAVDRLDAERRHVRDLRVARRFSVLVVVMSAMVSAVGLFACTMGPESLIASLVIGGLALFARSCVLEQLDGDTAKTYARAELCAREVRLQMELLDRLLDP